MCNGQGGFGGAVRGKPGMSEDMMPPARHSEEAAAGMSSSMEFALAGVNESLGGKRTLAEARGISDKALESMYGIARELYANGQYRRARQSFELLCLYDHENAKYWRALGACRELLNDYLGAAAALTFAASHMARPDRSLQLNLAECLMAAGQFDAAERQLGELLSAPKGDAGGEEWRDRAKSLQSQLSQRRRGS